MNKIRTAQPNGIAKALLTHKSFRQRIREDRRRQRDEAPISKILLRLLEEDNE